MKVPPNDVNAEMAVLGAVLLDSCEAWAYVQARKLEPHHFYKESHRVIFRVMQDIQAQHKEVDILILVSALRDGGKLDKVGGLAALSVLSNEVATVANVEHYIQIVLERYARREALERLTNVAESLYLPDSLPQLSDLAAMAQRLHGLTSPHDTTTTIKAAVAAHVQARREAQDGTAPQGLQTGMMDLDFVLGSQRVEDDDGGVMAQGGGLMPGQFVLLLGVTKHGKSCLARQMVLGFMLQGARVLYLTTEMETSQVSPLLSAQLSGVPFEVVQGKRQAHHPVDAQKQEQRMLKAEAWMASLGDRLVLDDHPGPSRSQIIASAERAMAQGGLDVLVVDHLHHTVGERGEGGRAQSEVLMATLRELMEWGRRKRVLVLVTAQALSVSAKEQRPPSPDEVSYCRTAAQLAHHVLAIYRPWQAGVEGADPQEAQVHLLASRVRPTGRCTLRFFGESGQLADMGDWRPTAREVAPVIPLHGNKKKRSGGGW